jgi:hypothetical protein
MLTIPELNFGFNDAENYKRRENKDLFNQIFVRTYELDLICDKKTFFLMGEKGTGKTAYAVYIVNTSYNNISANISYIRETEYQKFILLKQEKHLSLSDYTNIWKVIIYLLLSQRIEQGEIKNPLVRSFSKFRNLKKAIDEYYASAFSPEIIYAMNFVEQSKLAAELLLKYAKVQGENSSNVSFSESRFQTNLLYIQKTFEDALSTLKLSRDYLLFIDGIDIRPSSIPYEDYLECVKGLANAVWSINNDFFSSIQDSKGRMRAVLLIRPDIFDSLGLQNQNNKIRDNSVLLDWRTTYSEYRNSSIFTMADKLLSSQQNEELEHGQAWDYYFPYEAIDLRSMKRSDSSFISFLRFSLYRPRDIVTMLSILQENFYEQRRPVNEVFREQDFDHPDFRRKYADYLLGEIKDHLSFYYSAQDYELFLKFFEYLDGKARFNYDEYVDAYNEYINFLTTSSIKTPGFAEAMDEFLQFLYELNVISYVEEAVDESFVRWCFRERSPSNISPKVKTHLRYEIHYGLGKALNTGKRLIKKRPTKIP